MMISVAVRTVPQRAELFRPLMTQLLQMPFLGWHVSNDPSLTPNENGCRALDAAAMDVADWVLFLEDDAGLIDDFYGSLTRWMRDHERPDVHIYPLGCQYAELWDDSHRARGAWDYPVSAFYCSVAMLVRRCYAVPLVNYFRRQQGIRQGFDILSSRWHSVTSTRDHLVTPVPCLVEHLGDDSTLAENRSEKNVVGRFRGFPGHDYSYVGRE